MKGFIFRCNNKTYDEVLQRKLLGEERMYLPLVKTIAENDSLFLYNLSTYEITGPLKPTCSGSENIVPEAWRSGFPAQIGFEEVPETQTIPFKTIERIIKKYNKGIYPDMELDTDQLNKILKIINEKQ